jgi:hypothetical protein
MENTRNVYILAEKPETKRPLGRHRRRWKDNIKTDLEGIMLEVMDTIQLAQDMDQ